MNWLLMNNHLIASRLAVFRAQGSVRQGQISGDLRRSIGDRTYRRVYEVVRRQVVGDGQRGMLVTTEAR